MALYDFPGTTEKDKYKRKLKDSVTFLKKPCIKAKGQKAKKRARLSALSWKGMNYLE